MNSDISERLRVTDRQRAMRAAMARAGKNRKAGAGHPTTSDPACYTPDVLEFHAAIGRWQNSTGRKFPTWSEVLDVFKALGYKREAT